MRLYSGTTKSLIEDSTFNRIVTGWRLGDDGRWKIKSFTVLEESGIGCGCSQSDRSTPGLSCRKSGYQYSAGVFGENLIGGKVSN